MPIDFVGLAGTILSSFLIPIAKKAVEKVRDRLADDVSENAADHAASLYQKVWDRVTSLFSSDADKAVLDQFERHPERAAPLVETLLAEKLEAEQAVAQELSDLVSEPAAGAAGGASIGQIIADSVGTIGIVHAEGARISGMVAGVMIGPQSSVGHDPARLTDPDKDPSPS